MALSCLDENEGTEGDQSVAHLINCFNILTNYLGVYEARYHVVEGRSASSSNFKNRAITS